MSDKQTTEAVPFDATLYGDGILLNMFMNTIEDPNDPSKRKPYGKVGFQTLGPKTDKIVRANLNNFKEQLDNGKVKDLEGNVVYNHGVVMLYGVLSRPRNDDAIPQVAGFVDASSMTVVPIDAPVQAEEADEDQVPF